MININCCVNPFCYAIQYREFQAQVRNIFRKSNGQNQQGKSIDNIENSKVQRSSNI